MEQKKLLTRQEFLLVIVSGLKKLRWVFNGLLVCMAGLFVYDAFTTFSDLIRVLLILAALILAIVALNLGLEFLRCRLSERARWILKRMATVLSYAVVFCAGVFFYREYQQRGSEVVIRCVVILMSLLAVQLVRQFDARSSRPEALAACPKDLPDDRPAARA